MLAGALVTRRHFLKGAAILGVAVAVAPRVLVQVPESYFVEPDLFLRTKDRIESIIELSAHLEEVYGPSMEQQQTFAAKMYVRFDAEQIRRGTGLSYVRWS